MKAIVFDLDGTMFETSALQTLRDNRNWKACARNAGNTAIFEGMRDLFETLLTRGILVGVCTSSVSHYATRLLSHHQISGHKALVCYHDASPRKPYPAPILETLRRLGVPPDEAIGIGDRVEDALAYNAAGVFSVGAGWNPQLERAAPWGAIAQNPTQIVRYY